MHYMNQFLFIFMLAFPVMMGSCEDVEPEGGPDAGEPVSRPYSIVDTGVETWYDNHYEIPIPAAGAPFHGQDASYKGNQPSYRDNRDGTVTDLVTGLMWQQEMGEKISMEEAAGMVESMELGGYTDWRIPSIKELYSLICFTGLNGGSPETSDLFIDDRYFAQPWGDTEAGERYIDAQTWSCTRYVGTTMNGDETVFGVNFVDGRIKGYPRYSPRSGEPNRMYFRMVRGNTMYGKNNFTGNGDGTVSDHSTGLMWQQADDGVPRDWENALSYAESLELAGYSDWRLPNAKELQSIVDYSRAPGVTSSPAIDSLFSCTEITDPEGAPGQYPYYWTGTTHLDGMVPGSAAVYIAFGMAQGWMHNQLLDVHGAGAQRSDPKTGNPADYPAYWGPQGDVRVVFNYVRCVRERSPE